MHSFCAFCLLALAWRDSGTTVALGVRSSVSSKQKHKHQHHSHRSHTHADEKLQYKVGQRHRDEIGSLGWRKIEDFGDEGVGGSGSLGVSEFFSSSSTGSDDITKGAGLCTATPTKQSGLRWIFAITPTYRRVTQRLDMIRLLAAFAHVPNLYVVVVEDRETVSEKMKTTLEDSMMPEGSWALAAAPTTPGLAVKGSEQRNKGLDVMAKLIASEQDEQTRKDMENGVVFFADDDNAYDPRLFDEIRKVQKVGVWPVAFSGKKIVEHCKVDSSTGKVTGFDAWAADVRPFALDMAGMGLSVSFFVSPAETDTNKGAKLRFDPYSHSGMLESTLLMQTGISVGDLEPLADNCTKVYTWHVSTSIKWGKEQPPADFDKEFDV
uniref:Galactosylgalactosylxylosylprotein 3-beta-glucuronosyltransferase n=1 Tax=Chromera velia CCMP2878 TaxID=1169474 RepID=A0A0G4HWW3_9ALVE|eukprot:Cvel_1469.t1-p1 / transcript=Cvel_1469.t1 / gene=Cvel_1469 / organism=Chromera_velia_CCMP2878 / gene_product=Probable glucuronosyltransferase sqv-8, putative / transcript_product=Probable glucuronosyltransferase sqv-8, putative / location=Cvel_scaffold51:134483-137032(-) / protein_length=378 / sequence_SO=supercontig / SO=protein_coding / is_pseudo=false